MNATMPPPPDTKILRAALARYDKTFRAYGEIEKRAEDLQKSLPTLAKSKKIDEYLRAKTELELIPDELAEAVAEFQKASEALSPLANASRKWIEASSASKQAELRAHVVEALKPFTEDEQEATRFANQVSSVQGIAWRASRVCNAQGRPAIVEILKFVEEIQ